jgi:hypothetical protein
MKRKEIIEIAATSILIAVLILAVASAMKRPSHARRGAVKAAAQIPAAGDSVAPEGLQKTTPAVDGADAGDAAALDRMYNEADRLTAKRDPFTMSQEATTSGAALSGILRDKKGLLAVINNNMTRVGDAVGEKKVVEIKEDRVILSDGASETMLILETKKQQDTLK